MLRGPQSATPARLGEGTATTETLRKLPPPRDKVAVAVYKFSDLTGQYRPSENGANWSTAVTQGAGAILVHALEESGWFVPIEREGVGNLLNERKIIRSSRSQYQAEGSQQNLLPPLLYAGVLLEGGIVSYDANVITGGAGLRYFGVGGSGQYRQDRVTVYLRAVSTSNGKVLKTVYTSKTILSQALDAGLFQFVRFSRLLETEMGYTYNEPSQIAVTEAIEKAVQALIIEGIKDELWTLKEPRMMADQVILDYEKERQLVPQTDILGNVLDNRRAAFGFGLNASAVRYSGDFPDPVARTGVEAKLAYNPSPSLGLELNLGFQQLATERFYAARVGAIDLSAKYRILPFNKFTPFLAGGAGVVGGDRRERLDLDGGLVAKLNFGIGAEYALTDRFSLEASLGQHYLLSDRLDGVSQGKRNDFYYNARVGFNVYFGRGVASERAFDFAPDTGYEF